MKSKRKKMLLTILIIALLAVSAWIVWGNTALVTSEIRVISDKIPEGFAGCRIVQVSDLHNAEFGKSNIELIERIEQAKPDIIAITGDFVDSVHTNIESGLEFAGEITKIAPCYYVTGNHEARIDGYEQLIEGLKDAGVVVLQNESVVISRNNGSINLVGVQDPSFHAEISDNNFNNTLSSLVNDLDGYIVLLSHRPELFDTYVSNEIDLILTGHAHGGQFRLPFIGGLVAPGQGLLPEYDAGLYTKDNTNMIVSRGIGNSIIPFRVNNRPEIVVVELLR